MVMMFMIFVVVTVIGGRGGTTEIGEIDLSGSEGFESERRKAGASVEEKRFGRVNSARTQFATQQERVVADRIREGFHGYLI